jgi:hypothetical protein
VREIEALKAVNAHSKAVHKQQLEEVRAEAKQHASAMLEEHKRLHQEELRTCREQREEEKRREEEEVAERRRQIKVHRVQHRHGEVDEAEAAAEKEALHKAHEQALLDEHREREEREGAQRGGEGKRSAAEADAHHQELREERERRRRQKDQEEALHRGAAQRAKEEEERETEEKVAREVWMCALCGREGPRC